MLGLDARERERDERGRRGARPERAAPSVRRRVLPVVAVRARDRRCGEVVEERAHLLIVFRRAGVGEREEEVRLPGVAKLGAVLLEERTRRRRDRAATASGGEGLEEERLLIHVRGVRDVDGAVHPAEDVARRALHDAAVDRDAVALRLAEREEHPPADVRVALALRVRAPRPAAVGTLPPDDAREIGGDPAVAVLRAARALLGAADREGGDETARDVLGVLPVIGGEVLQLVGHGAAERRLHGHAQRAVLGVGERRQVHRLERAVLGHDAAGGGRLGRHVEGDRHLLLDRVGETAGPHGAEGDLRRPFRLDPRRPAQHL